MYMYIAKNKTNKHTPTSNKIIKKGNIHSLQFQILTKATFKVDPAITSAKVYRQNDPGQNMRSCFENKVFNSLKKVLDTIFLS